MWILYIFLAIFVVWFLSDNEIKELQRRVNQLEEDSVKMRTDKAMERLKEKTCRAVTSNDLRKKYFENNPNQSIVVKTKQP